MQSHAGLFFVNKNARKRNYPLFFSCGHMPIQATEGVFWTSFKKISFLVEVICSCKVACKRLVTVRLLGNA